MSGWITRAALVAASLLSVVALPAAASGLAQLKAFIEGARTGTATFRQVVASKSARVPQESSGTFAFARPGKFRWTYDKPYSQLLVADGDKLWIYDRDLNQVIVKKLDRALGATPAALPSFMQATTHWKQISILPMRAAPKDSSMSRRSRNRPTPGSSACASVSKRICRKRWSFRTASAA